jgi:hypothetical protein
LSTLLQENLIFLFQLAQYYPKHLAIYLVYENYYFTPNTDNKFKFGYTNYVGMQTILLGKNSSEVWKDGNLVWSVQLNETLNEVSSVALNSVQVMRANEDNIANNYSYVYRTNVLHQRTWIPDYANKESYNKKYFLFDIDDGVGDYPNFMTEGVNLYVHWKHIENFYLYAK